MASEPKWHLPNPGSWEAIDAGCACPVYDNCHGKGRPTGEGLVYFVYVEHCPVHNPQKCPRCERTFDIREDVISLQNGTPTCQRCAT